MVALVFLTVLFVAALYALGQGHGSASGPGSAALVPGVVRGARTLARVGDAWRPVEHLRA